MNAQLASAADPVAFQRLSTEGIRQRDQLDAWREFTASISDVELVDPSRQGYRASMDMCDLGSLQLVSFQQDPVIFHHSGEHVKRSGIDHWWLSVVKRGALHSGARDRDLDASAGSVLFKSFALPFSGKMEKTDFSCLFISRDDFWDIADLLDKASHRLVGGPMAHILGDFLNSVEQHAKALTRAEVPRLNEAFANLLKAALNPNADTLDAARQPIAATQFDRARRFIAANLKTPGLTPDLVSAQMGMSRRQLYYIFQRHGGVANYIRNRRLAACRLALTRRAETGAHIGAIAFEHGFTNLSSFYRQFHSRYGYRPGEARSAWVNGDRHGTAKATTFADWMSRIDQTGG